MNFFIKSVKLFAIFTFSFYIARYLGESILFNKAPLIALIFVGVCFLMLSSLNQKFILFAVTVFLPLYFPKFILKNLMWVELMGPFIFFLLLISVLIHKEELLSKNALIFLVAVMVIFLWSVINIVRNPVSAGFLGGDVKEGGMRAYLTVVVGIFTFWGSFWFFWHKEQKKLLISLFFVSLIMGTLRLLDFFIPDFDLFFLKVMETTPDKFETFYRIGAMSEIAVLGITSLLALQYKKEWTFLSIISLMYLSVLLILSGGRSMFLGTFLATIVYFVLTNRKYILPLILIFILLSGTYVFVSTSITLPGQVQRIIKVEGGVEQQDEYRTLVYKNYLELFAESPIFGKGIGWKKADIRTNKEKTDQFIDGNMMAGGHGSYISILAIYGIGGLFFLLVMLFGSLYHAYKFIITDIGFGEDNKLILFAIMNLMILTLAFYAGGNGVNNMPLWYLCGLVAGIKTKNEVKRYDSRETDCMCF